MNKCPQCGYVESHEVKQQHNIMNLYVDPKTGKVDGAYNCDEDKMVVKGKELIKQSLYKAPAPTPATPPKPATPVTK